jgi:signal peptidase II
MSFKYKPPQPGLLVIFIVTAAVFLFVDLWSKFAVFEFLADKPYWRYEVIPGWCTLVMRENSGAAWSMFAGERLFLTGISAFAMAALIVIAFVGMFKTRIEYFVLGMFTAGVAGNLYDRLFNDGKVRDFIDINLQINGYHWPTFNIADSLLCIGVGIYILGFVFFAKEKENKNDSTD